MTTSKKYQIAVSAAPQFIADQSDPEAEKYIFAYTMTIANVGTVAAQLISRHWIITDGNSQAQEVRGLGVVGQQPLLQPGEKFEYTSGTPLTAPSGRLGGNYQVQTNDGDLFEVEIPTFSLDSPHDIKRMH